MVMNIVDERSKARKVVEDTNFDYLIMFLICMDAVVLGLLPVGFADVNFVTTLFLLDRLCMAIFIVEMLIKMYAYGPRFFKSGWNVFDLVVITVSSLPVASCLIVLRTFRLFRLLRYVNRFKPMKNIINIFLMILPNFAAMAAVLGVFMYVFGILAVSLFGDVFVEFAELPSALFALVQAFSPDSGIIRPVMAVYPHAWIFFLSFSMISFLIVTSFFLSVISAMVHKEFKIASNL